ncbi:MAG: DUF3794 domain-containing protein [Clostridia bacterium]|nr:DUF3794 domain-containing protein [Clostridia bacterium]
MDKLKIEKQESQICVPLKECGGEQPFDCRITLPEYLGDIVRILRCTVCAVPGNTAADGDHISVDGTVKIRIAYLADHGGIDTYETTEQFTKRVDAPGIPADSRILTVITADKAVCRAVSSRSIEVKTVLRMTFRVYGSCPRSLVSAASGAGLQLKKAEIDVFDAQTAVDKQFTVEGAYTLPAENNAVARILTADAACRVTETRVITNKAMVRGEVTVQALYMPDGMQMPETVRFSMPFSEIVDAAGINDSMSVRVSPAVLSVDLSPKAARGGDMRELEGTATVSLILTAGKMQKLPVVTDVFSTAYETDIAVQNLQSVTDSRAVAESFTAEGQVSLEELSPQRILYQTARIGNQRIAAENGTLKAEGTVLVGLFVQSQGDSVSFAEKSVEFAFEKSVPAADGYAFTPMLTLTAADVALDGNNAFVRAEIFIEGRLDAVRTVPAVTEITVDESRPKQATEAGMVIYFPSAGETLWDIAKRYNASPEMLAGDNGIENGIVDGSAPLLIACV